MRNAAQRRPGYACGMATAELWTLNTVVLVGTTFALVALCVLLHYECLKGVSLLMARVASWHRRRILLMVFALFALHLAEIWLFGFGYRGLLADPASGALMATSSGSSGTSLLDCVYFSAVTFTTLGLGDVVPSGAIRFLVGTEALAGFMLLSWSAAFTFVEMQRYWRDG